MFSHLSPHLDFAHLEESALRIWQTRHIQDALAAARAGSPLFLIPAYALFSSRLPRLSDMTGRVIRDSLARFWSMRGRYVRRLEGWGSYGLAVEAGVERTHGMTHKSQIETYGASRFVDLCRRASRSYLADWSRLLERLGDSADPEEVYVSYTNDEMETVWAAIKHLYDAGLLTQESRVLPYCGRCGTALGWQDVELGQRLSDEPYVLLRFPLVEDPGTSLLVATGQPWKLPANVALAVHPDADYVIVERQLVDSETGAAGTERLILAQALVEEIFGSERIRIYESFKGSKLDGLLYHPLFTYLLPEKPAFRVIASPSINALTGTGLLPVSPLYGELDRQLAVLFDLPLFEIVGPDGDFASAIGPWRSQSAHDAEPGIIADLDRRGLLLQAGKQNRLSSFCPACATPLIDRETEAWLIRSLRADTGRNAQWTPASEAAQFEVYLRSRPDWVISRSRYWGTPLPIWECSKCGHQHSVGSRAELTELVKETPLPRNLFRPGIDEISFPCPACSETMRRIPDVTDHWFDAAVIPLAIAGENEVSLLAEAGETRQPWFASLDFLAASMEKPSPLHLVLSAPGLSEFPLLQPNPVKNKTLADELLDEHGADTFRWLAASKALAGESTVSGAVLLEQGHTARVIWKILAFFVEHARRLHWEPGPAAQLLQLLRNAGYTRLDRAGLSALHGLVRDATLAFEKADTSLATNLIEDYAGFLNDWLLRSARRRLLHRHNENDSHAALSTLYEILVTLGRLIAPLQPFLSEAIHQALVYEVDRNTPESVFLTAWPDCDASLINETLDGEMSMLRRVVQLGNIARSSASIPDYQPLAEAIVVTPATGEAESIQRYASLLAEQLNVKNVRPAGSPGEVISYRLSPRRHLLEKKYPDLADRLLLAIDMLEPEYAGRKWLAGESVAVTLGSENILLLPEDIEVITTAKHKRALATGDAYAVVLTLELTPELVQEGLALEFVRVVNELRQQAGLLSGEMIHLRYDAGAHLARALIANRDTILSLTEAVTLEAGEPEENMVTHQTSLRGESLLIGLKQE